MLRLKSFAKTASIHIRSNAPTFTSFVVPKKETTTISKIIVQHFDESFLIWFVKNFHRWEEWKKEFHARQKEKTQETSPKKLPNKSKKETPKKSSSKI